VAGALEADWNSKLRTLADAEQQYEQQRKADSAAIDPQQRERILALARDFPRLWQDPNTPDRERKRMARLLLQDVTLTKRKDITIRVRFKGGATDVLNLPLPRRVYELRKLSPAVIQEIDRLLDRTLPMKSRPSSTSAVCTRALAAPLTPLASSMPCAATGSRAVSSGYEKPGC